jgi:hypothetical protein
MVHLKGKFIPKHPEKYQGDARNIIFRSSWEFKVMRSLDSNPKVTKWASEEQAIPYMHPITGGLHRYFPDFLVEITENGKKRHLVLEVKPLHETKLPKGKSKKAIATFAINQRKWEAAKRWCDQKGYEFRILTEVELNIPPNG